MKTALGYLKNFFLGIPALLVSLLAVLKSCPPCPICMPKYAAILSFFGIPLAAYSQYLVPVMLLSMTFTLGTLFGRPKSPLSLLCPSSSPRPLRRPHFDGAIPRPLPSSYLWGDGALSHWRPFRAAKREEEEKGSLLRSSCSPCGAADSPPIAFNQPL